MKAHLLFTVASLVFGGRGLAPAAEPVFSGPQPGEKTTPFSVMELTGEHAGKERDPVRENGGNPTALVFVHGIERSLVPLLRTVDDYGALRKGSLKTEFVFLSPDRLEGEQRAKAAAGALKLQSRVGLSVDGIEGPGNYGLNKGCLMTVVIAKDNTVTANFALVQPGIADAPAVLKALAEACGDPDPPTVEQLAERLPARGGAEMGRGRPQADLTKFDLDSEAGLRDAVKALIGEVQGLRAEVAALKAGASQTRAGQPEVKADEPFPGAVPTDGKLQGMLRSFIRPTNDDATVDGLLAEVKEYIKGNADLERQAIDGWTRVLHFGDRYGTEYARKIGGAFLDELRRGEK